MNIDFSEFKSSDLVKRNMMMSMDEMRLGGGIRGSVKRRNVFVLAVWLLKC